MTQPLNFLLTIAVFLTSKPLLAQAVEPPKTEHGHPDL